MGFLSTIGKLLAGETISFEKMTHVNPAQNLLTADRQNYIGEWLGENTRLLIKPDGTIEYVREEIVGDTTNTNTISGAINSFSGASFSVGVLGQNTQFEVSEAPRRNDDGAMTMNVNGERLVKI
ncbi:MAG: hypothetical protein ABWZ66_09390 [Pyrinomonadaceae bacterium]